LVLGSQLIPEDLNEAATKRIATLYASVLHLAEDVGADEPWSSKRIQLCTLHLFKMRLVLLRVCSLVILLR
jgi:hypothetical protein